jgi:predicted acetyltransferase
MVQVPIDRFLRFEEPTAFRRIEPDDAASLESIRRIHANWASNYNFTMARTESVLPDWERLLAGSPWHDDDARFVFLSDHAYCVLKITSGDQHAGDGSQKLIVLDYAFETPAGRQAIFALMNNFAAQADTVRLQLATGDPLALEWSNFTVAHPHPLHARVVDAAAALTGLPAGRDVEFVIEVTDDFCAWNNANYLVDADGGQTRASTVDAPADVSVDVRALAQILSGSVTASATIRAGLAEGDAESISRLCRLTSRPCFMPLSDYF